MNTEENATNQSWEPEDETWLQARMDEIEKDARDKGGDFPEARRIPLERHLRECRLRQKERERPDVKERVTPDKSEGTYPTQAQEDLYESKRGAPRHIGAVIATNGYRHRQEHSHSEPIYQNSDVADFPSKPAGVGNWFRCPHELFTHRRLLELRAPERLFYAFLWSRLARYAGGKPDRTFFCRDSDAAVALGADRRTIRRWRRKLESYGLIRTWQRAAKAKGWTEPRNVVFYELVDIGPSTEQ